MDLEAFRWLLSDAGQRLLAQAAEVSVAEPDPLRAQAALRRAAGSVGSVTAARTAAAMTQVRLRLHARVKFGDLADRLYFTPEGLEQATRRPVAEHRAARLTAFGAASVIDLGCGVGGDLIALAGARITAAGVDLDPLRVAVAEANLAALGLEGAVTVADATTVDTSPFTVAFADPARRTSAGRRFDVADWTPPWPFVQRLLARTSCVKVAPGLPHHLVPDGVEAEWVSDRGQLKEAALWSGALATTAHRATVIAHGGLASITDQDDPGGTGVRPVGAFLHEPDPAVIRAGLVTAVAPALGAGLLDEQIAYLTGDDPRTSPFARSYRVLEELPFRERPLRAALRERGIGTLTIKKRGVAVVPEQLRPRLALAGEEEATIVLTRVAGAATCLRVRPVTTR